MFDHLAKAGEIANKTASDIAKDILSKDFLGASLTQKQDRRSRRTRGRLISALMQLLREKPLKNITVTELTELADVNRATFYSHYRDVFDMLNQIKTESCQVVREAIHLHLDEIADNNFKPLLTDLVKYIEQNRESISVILGPNGDPSFFNDIIMVLHQSCMEAVEFIEPQRRAIIKANEHIYDYHFHFIAGGIGGLLYSWFQSDMPESAETITEILNAYITNLPFSLFQANVNIADKDEQNNAEDHNGGGNDNGSAGGSGSSGSAENASADGAGAAGADVPAIPGSGHDEASHDAASSATESLPQAAIA